MKVGGGSRGVTWVARSIIFLSCGVSGRVSGCVWWRRTFAWCGGVGVGGVGWGGGVVWEGGAVGVPYRGGWVVHRGCVGPDSTRHVRLGRARGVLVMIRDDRAICEGG